MKLHHLLTTAVLSLSLAAGSALAQDEKAKKQAEIRKVTATSLERFYKADPKLKEAVANGAGLRRLHHLRLQLHPRRRGRQGLAQDNKTKKVDLHGHGAGERGPAGRGRARARR